MNIGCICVEAYDADSHPKWTMRRMYERTQFIWWNYRFSDWKRALNWTLNLGGLASLCHVSMTLSFFLLVAWIANGNGIFTHNFVTIVNSMIFMPICRRIKLSGWNTIRTRKHHSTHTFELEKLERCRKCISSEHYSFVHSHFGCCANGNSRFFFFSSAKQTSQRWKIKH